MWGCSSAGRALEWHSRGRQFDPVHLHQKKFRELATANSLFFKSLASGSDTGMGKLDKSLLLAPLTPHEARWASELSDKLPDDVDLTFEEIKILTRVPLENWPEKLFCKVKDVINTDDLQENDF